MSLQGLTAAFLFAAAPVLAAHQPPAGAPEAQPVAAVSPLTAAAGRVLRVFDFEERSDPAREDFNPEPVPRHWVRAQHNPPDRDRPGFPLVNKAEYDTTVAHAGRVSVKLPTRGGSTALRLSGTVLPIFPSVGYAVTAVVRTDGLKIARAFVAARLLDQRGNPIPGTDTRSSPVASTTWQPVRFELPGRFSQAAFIEIELLLLQPEQFSPAPLAGAHHVWPQDLSGAAWFDDLTVVQLPRVTLGLSEGAAPGISITSTPPQLTATIQDLTGEDMSARLTLRDVDDRVIAVLDQPLSPGGGRVDWRPDVPGFGSYRAQLEVLSAGSVVGRAHTRLLYLPPPVRTDPSFGLMLGTPQAAQRPLIAQAVASVGAGSATLTLPVEDPGSPASVATLRQTLDPLVARGTRVTLALPSVDPTLASALAIDADDPAALFALESTKWSPALRGLFDAFGQRVPRWLIGSASDPALLPPGDVTARAATTYAALSRFVPGPVITTPWRAEWAWPAGSAAVPSSPPRQPGPPATLDGALAIHAPPGFSAEALAELAGGPNGWRARRAGAPLSVVLEVPVDALSGRGSVIEVMRRAALLWEALDPWSAQSETTLLLDRPWGADDDEIAAIAPEPALAAWATLARHLGPRRVAGRLPAPPGVTCLVLVDARPGLDGSRTGALLLWNSGSATETAEWTQHLGSGAIVQVDAFGNTSPLRPLNIGAQYQLSAGPSPVFVEGVDAELALFIQGLRLATPFIRAEASEHEHTLMISNPWPTRIVGEIQLAPPRRSVVKQSWRFTPTAPIPFALAPGEKAEVPISFSFSAAEESGDTELTALVRFASGASHPPLVLGIPATIGIADLQMQASVVLSPTGEGPDVIVTASVTATGTRARSLQVESIAPGHPTQQQPVSGLLPGENAVRRFIFKGAAAQLAGKRVRISITDAEGTERLNRSVLVR